MKSQRLRQLGWWGASLGYMGLIFYLSSRTLHISVNLFPHWDKVVHFTEYAALSALLFMAFRSSFPDRPPVWMAYAAAVAASLYGLSDEFHQSFVPGREAGGMDWVADIAGSMSVVLAAARRKGKVFAVGSRYPSKWSKSMKKL